MPSRDVGDEFPTHKMTPPLQQAVPATEVVSPKGRRGENPVETPFPRTQSVPPRRWPTLPGYQIDGELGRGGMGVVYRAQQEKLKRTVAIKMLPAEEQLNPLDLARFSSEAEVVASIRHPHVVQVFEFAQYQSRPYLVMEYLPGGSLAAKLQRPLPIDEAVQLVEKLARGMQAAHELGIVHRDLKPGNVLFDAEGEPRITDFGLAKRTSSNLTQTQTVMGTPAYMAPEQASGRTKYTGPAADLYALGTILYECLTGDAPFGKAEEGWQIIQRVIQDSPPSLRSVRPELSRDLELICLRCLEKEPLNRYPSAALFAQDLRRYLNREPVSVRPSGLLERSLKWAKRRPWVAAVYGMAVLLVFLLLMGGVMTGLWQKAEEARSHSELANRVTVQEKLKAEQARLDAEQARDQLETQRQDLAKSLQNETTAKQELAQAQDALETTKYFQNVALALRVVREGKLARAEELLKQCPPAKRGWEWWHCQRMVQSEQTSFPMLPSVSVCYNGNGTELVSYSNLNLPRAVEYRESETGRLLRSIPMAFDSDPISAELSPNGTHLIVPEIEFVPAQGNQPEQTHGHLRIHELKTGAVVANWKKMTNTLPRGILSRDGSTTLILDIGPTGSARSFDLKTGKLLAELKKPLTSGGQASLSTDGKFALTKIQVESTWANFVLWDTRSGEVKQEFDWIEGNRRVGIARAELTPDGKLIVMLTDLGGVLFWKVGDKQPFVHHPNRHVGSNQCSLTFSQDGELCASWGQEQGIRVWRTQTGERVNEFFGHKRSIAHFLFHPDGLRVLAIDSDGVCKSWNAFSQPAKVVIPQPGIVPSWLAIDDRMESLLAPFGTTPDKLLLKDLKTHKEVQAPRPPQEILDAQFQPAGQHLLLFTRDNALPGQPTGLELRNRATGELVRTIAHPKEYAAARPVYSANGTRLMTPKGLRAAVVCDATTGQELATFQVPIPSLQLWAFALSGDGKRYACAAQTGRIWIGDVATNRLIADGSIAHDQATSLFSLAFNREGTLLAGGWANGKVTISKVPDPPSQGVPNRMKFPLRFFLDSHTAPVVSVCFSPLGDRLLSGSETGEALLWDTATGQETIEFKLPNADRLHRVQFSADGHRIALIGRTFGAVVLDGSPRK